MIALGLTLARPSLAPASPPTRPSLALKKVFIGYFLLDISLLGAYYWMNLIGYVFIGCLLLDEYPILRILTWQFRRRG